MFFEEHAMGITQSSLRVLRDALANSYNHEIAVIQVSTAPFLCGFLVLDKDAASATFTGDGFRTDHGGEGGAGYQSALLLFDLFGITFDLWHIPVILDPVMDTIRDTGLMAANKQILELFQHIADSFESSDFSKPADNKPRYARAFVF